MLQEKLSNQMIQVLNAIHFPQRYYNFYEQKKEAISSHKKKSMASHKDLVAAFSSMSLDFKYYQKENLMTHKEKFEQWELVLNIAFTFDYVELILSIKNEHEYAGGPFPKLAREAAQLLDPEFKYSPASPKIPFSNLTEFLSAVNFGISVFQEVKQAILPDEIKQSYLSCTK
ncbi:MAG: hypothetical protein SAK29_19985 [Scytonema sp. PMC 1069.18]|nr:hypothetical protein [Scytonema sp. PMC 1069.18]MEC4887492.1 hypothetical protein [Scytonema sp. PMC 1070.18]